MQPKPKIFDRNPMVATKAARAFQPVHAAARPWFAVHAVRGRPGWAFPAPGKAAWPQAAWGCIFKPLARRTLAAAVAFGLIAAHCSTARAETGGLVVLRDAEIEQLLREYTAPVFRAAGIPTGAAKVILVGDRSFNAFVADGQKIFVNTGALMESKTPNEIIGVLAHESGHIAGGHLVRQRQALAAAQIMSVVGMLVSAGAIAGGANSKGRIGSDAAGATGVLLGPQEMVRRSLLSYQRGEEQAADRAAVTYLGKTGQSAKGLLSTLERFSNDALFKTSAIDPYLITHPLPAERISNLQAAAKASPSFETKDAAGLQARHDMMRAKLFGFTGDKSEVARRYPQSDTSLPARYARAVIAYRFSGPDEAVAQINGLILAQPGNPYFYELKGQALLEAGRAAEAVPALRKANAMVPDAVPIKVMLGHALVAMDTKAATDEAIKVLANASQRDQDSSEAFEFLAMAYDRKGNQPQAQLAAAQAMFVSGRYVEARTQASRAQKQLKEGSPGWLKADDILNYRPPEF